MITEIRQTKRGRISVYVDGEFLFAVFVNLFITRWRNEEWFLWWQWITVGQGLLYGAVTTIWFTWGGVRDLRRLFRHLKTIRDTPPDESDDGRVE